MACWGYLQAQQQKRSLLLLLLLLLQRMHTMGTMHNQAQQQQQLGQELLALMQRDGCRRCLMPMAAGATQPTIGQQQQPEQWAAVCVKAALLLVVLWGTATWYRHRRLGRVATGLTAMHSSICSRHVLQVLRGCMGVRTRLVHTTALLL
jgi:hypothetical protein